MLTPEPEARQQFVVVREIEADAPRVFAALHAVSDMQRWIPMCESVRWTHPQPADGPGEGSLRTIRLAGGVTVVERLTAWCDGVGLNYCFEPPSAFEWVTRRYEGRTNIQTLGRGRSRLIWAAHWDAPGTLALIEPGVRLALRILLGNMASGIKRVAETRLMS